MTDIVSAVSVPATAKFGQNFSEFYELFAAVTNADGSLDLTQVGTATDYATAGYSSWVAEGRAEYDGQVLEIPCSLTGPVLNPASFRLEVPETSFASLRTNGWPPRFTVTVHPANASGGHAPGVDFEFVVQESGLN